MKTLHPALAALLLSLTLLDSAATTYQWNSSATSAQWSAAGVWSPDGTPGADDIIGTPLQTGAVLVGGNRAVYGIDVSGSWTIRSGASGTNTLTIGAGGLVKSGSGTLLIRDENTTSYFLSVITDSITVNAGTLAFGSGTSAPVSSLFVGGTTTVATGASLSLYSTSTTLSGGLQNAGTVTLSAGPADTAATVAIGGLSGSGIIRVATGESAKTSTLKIDLANGTANYGGTITNGGTNLVLALEKTGSGTQVISSAAGYSGGTTVSQGALLVANTTGSGVGSGAVEVKDGGVFGGTGIVVLSSGNAVTVESGGVLLGGDGAQASSVLTIANNLTLQSGSLIRLSLGASGAHSSISRTAGTWNFASDQSVFFDDIGGGTQTGIVYTGLITGLASDPGVSGWSIANEGWEGVFSYESGSVSVVLSTIPEPSSTASTLAIMAIVAASCVRSRRSAH